MVERFLNFLFLIIKPYIDKWLEKRELDRELKLKESKDAYIKSIESDTDSFLSEYEQYKSGKNKDL